LSVSNEGWGNTMRIVGDADAIFGDTLNMTLSHCGVIVYVDFSV
jgi:hypothetical protein